MLNTTSILGIRTYHATFGFGHHNCLGAHHARAIMRCFRLQISQTVSTITVVVEEPCMEVEKDYTRQIGFSKPAFRCNPIQ